MIGKWSVCTAYLGLVTPATEKFTSLKKVVGNPELIVKSLTSDT